MSLGNVSSNSVSQLQSALESARQRTNAIPSQKVEVEKAEMRKPQRAGGSLFDKIYAKAETPKIVSADVGSRLDVYA